MLKDILKKRNDKVNIKRKDKAIPLDIPEGLFMKCQNCDKQIYKADFIENVKTCPNCGFLGRLTAEERINLIADEKSFNAFDSSKLEQKNPLNFPEYDKKLSKAKTASGLEEAVLSGICAVGGQKTVVAVMDSHFMMGSMGSLVGEIITEAIEFATKKKMPIIIFTASGGARMQEGIVSLMQMAKTSSALAKHADAGLLYITVICDPTTGGVTASFASLGDIILAEKGALIGFAGRRVIEQTIRQKLPKDFQTSEFMLEKGFIDKVIDRKNMKRVLKKILELHK